MKHFFIFLFASVVCHSSFSQDSIVQYFDKHWLPISSAEDAAFFRTVEEKERGFTVRDYYADTKKEQMVAECSAYTPKLIFNGTRTLYSKNGAIESTSQWVDNKQRGTSLTFYDNGKPKGHSEVTEDGERYKFYLSKDGTDLLSNGSAIVPLSEDNAKVSSFMEIGNHKVLAQFQVDGKNDTTYSFTEKQAEYKTGLEGLAKDLQNNVKYPTSARRSGVEGTVFVSFKVNKNGQATGITLVKGIGAECDQEALRVVELLAGNWSPATHRGKPVATRFVLPVRYRLTGPRLKK
ncbi:MAG: TonB family protein [Chryseolinea sp.]